MKVLIAVDNTQFAHRLVDAVSHRQWAPDTQFILLHVVEQSTGWFSGMEPDRQSEAQNGEFADAYLKQLMMELKRKLPSHEVLGETALGGASEIIVRIADQLSVDLIVLGSQGAAARNGHSIGGVAEAVVHRAHCSVEIIKPKVEITAKIVETMTA